MRWNHYLLLAVFALAQLVLLGFEPIFTPSQQIAWKLIWVLGCVALVWWVARCPEKSRPRVLELSCTIGVWALMVTVGVVMKQTPYILAEAPQWLGPTERIVALNPILGWLISAQLTLTVLYMLVTRRNIVGKIVAAPLPMTITLVGLWLWMQDPPKFSG